MKSHQKLPSSACFTLALALATSFSLISSIAIAQTLLIDWESPIDLDIQQGFTPAERERLYEAVEILNSKFSSLDYGDDDAIFHAHAYRLEPRARKILKLFDCYPEMESGLARHFEDYGIRMRRDDVVIFMHLTLLPFFPGQTKGGTYQLRVYPVNEPPGEDSLLMGSVASNQAYHLNLDCRPGVTVMDGSGSHYFGEFKMKINRYALRRKTTSEIAGTLLHEMLHVLGHNHPPPGEEDAYSDEWQINAITNSFRPPGGFSEFSEVQNGNTLYLYSNP